MQQRLPSLIDPPITFAHRGAKAHAPENTIEAFELALKLGASGLESDVWVTSDGIVVLDHDGDVRTGVLRKRPISEFRRDELPEHIPALTDLLDACGTDYHLSLDLKDPTSGPAVIEVVRSHAPDLLPRLWLCEHDRDRLLDLRAVDETVRVVFSTRLGRLNDGPERHAAWLAEHRIDCINMHKSDWNGGLVALFHRFDRYAFCWDLQHDHELRPALRMGMDGIYSDHTDRMHSALVSEVG